MPKAYFYAGLTLLMWATVATAFKLTLHVATVLQTLWVSTLVSSFTLLVICAARGEVGALYPAFRRTPGLTLLAALLNPVAYYLVLFEAYDRCQRSSLSQLNITWTIVLALMAGLILKQPVRWVDYAAAGIGFFGVLIIVSKGNGTSSIRRIGGVSFWRLAQQ